MDKWRVSAHREVIKKDIPKLEQAGLKNIFDEIVENLKVNPYKEYRNFEKLHPYNMYLFSLRENNRHRVVYTIDKKNHKIKIWSAWTHYEKRIPKK